MSTALLADLRIYVHEHLNRANPTASSWPGRKPGTHAVDFDRQTDMTNFLRWYFSPALRHHGLPKNFRLHDLRHTAASLWPAAGEEPYKVSRWLGHSDVAFADSIYSHLYPSDYAAERARFDAYAEQKAALTSRGPHRRRAR